MSFSPAPRIAGSVQPQLLRQYRAIRAQSLAIAKPLSGEDQSVQSMPDTSPTKWHLAHSTWFFERIVLARSPGYEPFDRCYDALFNSYYLSLGTPFARCSRGLLTRPSLAEIMAYRVHVDEEMETLLAHAGPERRTLTLLGLQHEQQHQELMLTDIKHAFFCNPLYPAYSTAAPMPLDVPAAQDWFAHPGGTTEIGHDGKGFAFDNEGPRHAVHLRPFKLAARPVTNGEYRAFIEDGGYRRPGLWLSDGWAKKEQEGWTAPLYWLGQDRVFALDGVRALDPGEPVAHVSFYEASAYAAWVGLRLPTEFEWEAIANRFPCDGNFLDLGVLRPRVNGAAKLFGDVWCWTRSSYDPYPGYRPFEGALGEYNGKFMVGQMVLRGGSCVTPVGHIRATYRNFFAPAARWQFSGIRLAADI